MTLRLEIISEQRSNVGDDAVRVFGEEGGTIGRAAQNDWVLPDPDRFVSGRHATIDCRGGSYYLMDTSTNGVYVNSDREPIGKGVPRRLFNGDRLGIGDFEIFVTIDEGESLVVPFDDANDGSNDHARSLVEEDSMRSDFQLLDENEITGDDEFQSALFGGSDSGKIAQLPNANVQTPHDKEAPAATTSANEPHLLATDLVDSFLDGLGISRSEIDPSTDLGQLMQSGGEMLREFIGGTDRLLGRRKELRKLFQSNQPPAAPRHSDPGENSETSKELIKQLLLSNEREYLGPRDAAHQICRDLLFLHDAFLDSIQETFSEFIERLNPEELETDVSSGRWSLTSREKRCWQMYCDLYPIITDKTNGLFPSMFAEDFFVAYQRKMDDYEDLAGSCLYKETVVRHRDNLGAADPTASANAKELRAPAQALANEPLRGQVKG